MKKGAFSASLAILIIGDIITLALTTLLGFAYHRISSETGTRMLATFLPALIAWLLVAPHLGAFDTHQAVEARQLWRPFWAMLLSAPLAAFLRGAWLGLTIQPLFVAVLGGVNALAILAWRGFLLLLLNMMRRLHG